MKFRMLKLLGGCAVAVVLALMLMQRAAISRTRVANDTLYHQNAASASVVVAESSHVSRDEIEALRAANRDLPKLRNEVRQLREEKREFERLQAENERLAASLKAAPKASAPRMTEAEGFVLKERWAHAGFATPEATLQTFFWAAANKNIAAMAECLAGEARKSMEKELQRSAAQGKQFEEQFEPFTKIQGFRIAEKKQVSEDKVELGLQATAGGQVMPMPLRRFNGEWKFAD